MLIDLFLSEDHSMQAQVWGIATSTGWAVVVTAMLLYMIFGPA